ncbi:hypothetical protein CHLRE_17g713025v5 [Chlamydomonas reinhardtii]|uniref:Protein kinase domain-containing protein n=1 Tax=Chlamydomonas reinhardtii TaxID=3055 RepID=A0A2K3CPT0_CHLRE|nr:uncharacterized protein CHLRE_17g713025v5 [Chlamydomonas reinhardtii]PNW70273.1 hypothetical protein CHLRE_17g713025v5 [Chlamydomonas reinhardtii]
MLQYRTASFPLVFVLVELVGCCSAIELLAGTEPGIAVVRSGVQLAAAFADASVHTALVDVEGVRLTDSDFSAHELPIPVTRNFTIEGKWQLPLGRWPYMDWAYLRGKVRLAPGVTLTLDRLMTRRTRSDPSFRAPGFDVVTDDSGRDPNDPSAFALIVVKRCANLQEVCLPPSLVAASVSTIPRPPQLPPGNQISYSNTTIVPLHPNCSGSSSPDLPFEQQCISSSGGVYLDFGLFCYTLDAFGNQVKTGYVSQVVDCDNLCYQYMTLECTKQYGIAGCFNLLKTQQEQDYQNTTNGSGSVDGGGGGAVAAPPPPRPVAGAALPPPLAPTPGPGAMREVTAGGGPPASGAGGRGGNTAAVIGAVVGGVAGGLLLATGITAAVVRVRRRRHAAAASGGLPTRGDSGSEGGSSCWDKIGSWAAWGMPQGAERAGGHGAAYGLQEPIDSSHAGAADPKAKAAAAPAARPLDTGVFWSLVPVTPLTPFQPHIPLNVTPLPAPTTGGGNLLKSTVGSSNTDKQGPVARGGGASVVLPAVPEDLHVLLTEVLIGKGAFSKVVEGHYCGRRVAVKQIDTGLLLQHQQQHQPPSCAAAALDRESGEGDVPPPPSSAHQQQDVQQQQQQPPAGPESPSPAAAPPPATQAAAAATVAAGGAATAAAAGVPAAAAAGSQQLPLAYTQALTVYVSSAGAFPVTASDASNSSNSASPQQKQGQQQPQVPPAVAIGHAQSSSSQNRKFQDSLIAILEQEVQVLARVQHPNIVTLLAANLVPPHVCLVMERMDTSLDRLLYKDPNRPLPLSLAVHIALQVARALEYLHPTIIHRDLKPGNVLISNADASDETQVVAKLADFGLSRLQNTTLITQEPGVGTGPYMAPECFDINNIAITDRADCYSFGVLLWELVTRSQPWAGLTVVAMAVRVVVNGERLPMSPLALAGAPAKLQKLVTQCFEADPRRRPAAAEIVKVLMLVQQQLAAGVYDSL